MAENDDRWVPEVRGEKGVPSLTSLNEVVKLIFQALHVLEGRVGEVNLRDSLSVNGDLEVAERVKILAQEDEPEVTEDGEVGLYYDLEDEELKASYDGGDWETFPPPASSVVLPIEKWHVHNSVGQNTANNISLIVVFDTVDFSEDVTHTSTSRITIDVAGKYVLGATLGYAAETVGFPGTGSRSVLVSKNGGTPIVAGRVEPLDVSAITTVTATALVNLEVGDYLEVVALQDSGETLALTAGQGLPQFWGHRLSD